MAAIDSRVECLKRLLADDRVDCNVRDEVSSAGVALSSRRWTLFRTLIQNCFIERPNTAALGNLL